MAAGLSVLVPAGFTALLLIAVGSRAGLLAPALAGLAAGPLLAGAGDAYSGDWARAAAVSAGGLGVSVLGGLAGYALSSPSVKYSDLFFPVLGWTAASLGYSGYAAWDAYRTAALRDSLPRSPIALGAFPREHMAGTVLGIGGPGIAYRQFLTPEWGFQAGLNALWVGGTSFGGQIFFSPYHRNGTRVYAFLGGAYLDEYPSYDLRAAIPSLGMGISGPLASKVFVYLDVSWLAPINFTPYGSNEGISPGPYPQAGLMFAF